MTKQQGFTLVELAIVITIIGLLIGGVLKGQELLQNARMTSAQTKTKAYAGAAMTFKDVYKALPGDIASPGNFLQNCTTAPCNVSGNANGIIGPENAWGTDENNNFWLHLAKANLITGIDPNSNWTSGTYYAASMPAFDLGGQLELISYNHPPGSYPDGVQGAYYLIFSPTSGGSGTAAIVPTRLIAKYDLKVDDGKPWQGDVIVLTASCGMAVGVMSYDVNVSNLCYAGINGGFK